MSDWMPREHDHLVEPVFRGLGVEPERAAPRSNRGLLLATLLAGALIAVRAWMLLAR